MTTSRSEENNNNKANVIQYPIDNNSQSASLGPIIPHFVAGCCQSWQQDSHLPSKSLCFTSSLRQTRSSLRLFFVYPTDHMCKSKPGALRSMQAEAPSPSHNRNGSEKMRTFDKSTHHQKPFDRRRFVSVLWLRHAQLRDLGEL